LSCFNFTKLKKGKKMEKEFKYLGLTIERISLFYGIFLITWGVVISFLSKSNSFTSFIPSFFGLVILVFSLLAIKVPSKKKLFIHIVVLIGLIVFLGGLDLFRSISVLFDNFWADLSKLMLLLTGLWFTIINIRSFIFIRKNRKDL
tara:strand:- start:556 stop:993 length:438 start_codon:yes stop_codon:yes gene_type:complete